MNSFYFLHYIEEENYKPFGVVHAPEDIDLFLLPVTGVRISSWTKIRLYLKEGDFCDYLSNDLGGRLCSEKLKKIIDEKISESDEIQWLETIVVDENGLERNYFILHFPVAFEILNKEKSIMASEDVVVKPVLSKNNILGHNIFGIPNEGGRTTFVSEEMKKHIERNNCTGLSFSKVRMV